MKMKHVMTFAATAALVLALGAYLRAPSSRSRSQKPPLARATDLETRPPANHPGSASEHSRATPLELAFAYANSSGDSVLAYNLKNEPQARDL